MKKIVSLILLSACFASAPAQRKPDAPSVKKQVIAPSYAWKIIEPLGLREPATLDTLPINYGQESVPSMRSDAWATTGNFGTEGINMILSERKPISNFFFEDAIETWLPTSQTMKFYNTRIPMTLLSFNSAGGRDNSQERLSTIFSGNFNSKAQFGALLDYLYSKGCYNYQAEKILFGDYPAHISGTAMNSKDISTTGIM